MERRPKFADFPARAGIERGAEIADVLAECERLIRDLSGVP